jgi:hypothetical protein
MKFQTTTRHFYTDELKILNSLLTKTKKESKSKIKFYHFVFAGLLGAGFVYITSIIPESFWTFLFGTIAVFCFAFIVFMPYEIYKDKKRKSVYLQTLQNYIDKQTIETYKINGFRIAIAPEFEDESDLYIVELKKNKVLYLWDTEYNLKKTFPCLNFEIYEDKFFKLTSIQIYPLSEKIEPIKIDKKAKWNYIKKYGVWEHLDTENIGFDELLEKYNNCA